MTTNQAQVILAPSQEPVLHPKSIFLAGSTSPTSNLDWRALLTTSLSKYPIAIFNPYRLDWDSTWREDIDFAPYREQVNWELDKQEQADLVVVYFHPETQAPVSLLELGLAARSGEVIVVCPEGYWKRGNVRMVCEKFEIMCLDRIEDLEAAVVEKLELDEM